MATDYTKKMLNTIREGIEKSKTSKVKPLVIEKKTIEEENFLTRSKSLMEEAEKKNTIDDDKHGESFSITKKTPQFGDVRVSQEEALLKTIGEQIKMDEDSLLYYPEADDLVLNAEIPSMNTSIQFRFNDPSSEGVYIWSDALQLTEANARLIGKIRDAFMNWKQNLVQDGDLMDKLKKVCEKNK